MKRVFRNIQTFFPFLQDARFSLESRLRTLSRHVHDEDWRAFGQLKIGYGVIVDVGANRGQSIDSFQVIMSERSIVSFEPNARLAARLARRHTRDQRVRIEPVALSSKNGKETLHLPKYRSWIFDGLASLDAAEAMNWLNSDRLWRFDSKKLTHVVMDIEVKTLDAYDLAPAIIKLDTQGTEEDVLRGGLNTIATHRPIILLESSTQGIIELLAGYGYRPYTFYSGKLHCNVTSGKNVFFLTADHYCGE